MPRPRRLGRIATAVMVVAALGALTGQLGPVPAAAQTAGQTLWGIDSCAAAEAVIPGTLQYMGDPQFIARYMGPSPCNPTYPELSSAEVHYIQSQGVGIMLTSDPGRFGAASQQAAQGTAEAQAAIQQAQSLGAPPGTAIFRDIEKSDSITAAYIESWYQTFAGSGTGYVPGFYENSYGGPFTCAGTLNNLPCPSGPGAYCQAYAAMPAIATGVVLWDSEFEPEYGNSSYNPTAANAPAWDPSIDSPQYPLPCPNTTVAWQYLECGGYTQCENPDPMVDVDEFLSADSGLLWGAGAAFNPLTPFRVCDTRQGTGTPCSGSSTDNRIGPAHSLALQVTGIPGSQGQSVPPTAKSVVLNLTATQGTVPTYLTVYPTGGPPPVASNLNVLPGATQANLVVVPLGAAGQVSIYNYAGSIDVAVDVEGYFAPPSPGGTTVAGLFHPISPLRICDTRASTGTECSGTPLGPGQWQQVVVSGCPTGNPSCPASIPSDGTAAAAALNLTAVQDTGASYLSVVPTSSGGTCPGSPASTSNLNVVAGSILPNRVIVPLGPTVTGGPDTAVCVFNQGGTVNVILDLNGWFGSGAEASDGAFFHAIAPRRICDTRSGTGSECTGQTLGSGGTLLVQVAGVDSIPAATGGAPPVAVVANVTAVDGTAPAFLTMYPAGETPMPTASDLNVEVGQVIPNLVITELAPSGTAPGAVDLYHNLGSIDSVVDVEGWFQ